MQGACYPISTRRIPPKKVEEQWSDSIAVIDRILSRHHLTEQATISVNMEEQESKPGDLSWREIPPRHTLRQRR